ncbi:MAG TPA: putative quinol monooxygenase [Micropepsaceae bacterium]|nr:putative quinol monooxygenase [Micropepsaceae bacterium]
MIIVLATARIHPDDVAKVEAAGRAMVAASNAEEGCLGYSYAWDISEPHTLRVSEKWKDEAALRFHFSTPHMAAFLAALGAVRQTAPIDVKMFDAANERPLRL